MRAVRAANVVASLRALVTLPKRVPLAKPEPPVEDMGVVDGHGGYLPSWPQDPMGGMPDDFDPERGDFPEEGS